MKNTFPLYREILASGASPGTIFLILKRMKETGRTKEVIHECLKALDVYPNDINIRTLLAESYIEEEQLSLAESELEKVAAQIDNIVSSYILQAEIFIRQKKTQDAAKALNLYLAHHPDDDSALYLLNKLKTTDTFPSTESTPSPNLVSQKRPSEIKGIPDQMPEKGMTRKRKEKMIAVLESWLGSIREQSKEGLNDSGAFGPWPVDH
jgi:tetratricopeptide (TPR) repeat protein